MKILYLSILLLIPESLAQLTTGNASTSRRPKDLSKVLAAVGGSLSKDMENLVGDMSSSAQTAFSSVCNEMKSVTSKFKPSPGSTAPPDPCQDKKTFSQLMSNQEINSKEQFEVMMASMDNSTKSSLQKLKTMPAFNMTSPPPGFRGKDYTDMANKLAELSPELQTFLNSSNFNGSAVNNLTSADLKKLAPFVPMMSADVMKAIGSSLSSSKTDELCKSSMEHEQKNGGGKGMEIMAQQGINCIGAMAQNPDLITDTQKRGLVAGMKQKAPSTWSSTEFKQVMQLGEGAMDDQIMKQFPDDQFNQMWMSGDSAFQRSSTHQQTDLVKRQMATKAKSACGANVAAWNDTCLQRGLDAGILDGMAPTELKDMDPKKLVDLDLISKLGPSTGEDDSKVEITKRLVRKTLDPRSFNLSDVTKTVDVWIEDPNMMKNIPESVFIESLDSIKSKFGTMKPTMKGKMLTKLRRSSQFTPSNMTATELEKIGPLLSEMPPSDLESIPDTEMMKAFDQGSFKDATFKKDDKANMRRMFDKYKTASNFNPCAMNSSSAQNFGDLLSVLSIEELSCLPNEMLSNITTSLGKAAKLMEPGQRASLGKKMMVDGSKPFTDLGSEDIAASLPFALLKTNRGKLGINASASFPYNNLPKEQYMYFCEEMQTTLGAISETNAAWTGSAVANFPCIMAFCSNTNTQNLSTDSIMGIAEQVAKCPVKGEMSDTQVKAIGNKCMQYLSLGNMSTLTGTDVTPCAQFLRHSNSTSDFTNMAAATMSSLIQEAGKGTTDDLTREQMKEWATTSLKNTNRDSTQSPVDRSSATSLDDIDLSQMGTFVCGLGKNELGKLNENAVLTQGPTIRDCPMNASESQAFVTSIKGISDWYNRSEVISILAPFAQHLTDNELSQIDTNELAVATMGMAANFDNRDAAIKRREDRGMSDMTSTEKSNEKAGQARILSKGFSAMQTYQARRRKRSTTAVTCADAKAMGTRVTTTLTDSDISGMSTSEFSTCTEFFGSQTTWNSSKIATLKAKVLTVHGSSVSSWSSELVRQIGVIAAGLSSSEIQTLNISLDALSSIGVSTLLTDAQLQAGINRYLTSPVTLTLSTLSDVTLMGMKEFFCGLTTTQMSSLSSTSISRALPTLGTLTKCSALQMTQVWTLLKNAMGSLSSGWSTAMISEMRNIISGVPGNELVTFTTAQVAAIPSTSIPLISADNFKQFSTAQLQAMSSAQVNMMTTQQKSALTSSQTTAVNSVTGTTSTGGTEIIIPSMMHIAALIFVQMAVMN